MTLQSVAASKEQLRNTIMVPSRVLPTIVETLFNENVVRVSREDFIGGCSFHVRRILNDGTTEYIWFSINLWDQNSNFSIVTLAGELLCRGNSTVELVEFLQNQGADICDPFIVDLLSAK